MDRLAIVDPVDYVPGVIGVAVPESCLEALKTLERERRTRKWVIRGVVSDCMPLAGDIRGHIERERFHNFFLNTSPQNFFLQGQGRYPIVFKLVAQSGSRRLDYIEVKVETDLPSNAFSFARQPLNELLDALIRNPPHPPLILQRLELLLPETEKILAYEVTLPFNHGVEFGPLAGVLQWPDFAPYYAIFREAITTSSPFYRLLCAHRIYEGVQTIRMGLRSQCQRLKIDAKLPKDPEVDVQQLEKKGFSFNQPIRRAADLFNFFRDLRTGIAHFLIDGDEGSAHIYLARAQEVRTYSAASALLLGHASRAIEDLRLFYSQHLEAKLQGAHIFPMPGQEDQFIVRHPEPPSSRT